MSIPLLFALTFGLLFIASDGGVSTAYPAPGESPPSSGGGVFEPSPLFQLGQEFFEKGEWSRSRSFFFRLVNLYPVYPLSPLALLRIGEALEREGRTREGEWIYRQLVQSYPASDGAREARLRLIDIQIRSFRRKPFALLREQTYREAMEACQQIARENPKTPWENLAHLRMGVALCMENRTLEGLAFLHRATEGDLRISQSREARSALQRALQQSIETLSAQEWHFLIAKIYYDFQPFHEEIFSSPKTLFQIADSLRMIGLVEQSLGLLKKLDNRQDVDRPAVLLSLGQLYRVTGKQAQAANKLEELVQKFPDSPEASKARGELPGLYRSQGKVRESGETCRKSSPKGGGEISEECAFLLAESLWEGGNYTEAVKRYKEYVIRYPRGEGNLWALYRILRGGRASLEEKEVEAFVEKNLQGKVGFWPNLIRSVQKNLGENERAGER